MISGKSLDRAQSALAAVREMDLGPHKWRTVAEIVQRIQRAIHVGDEEELNDAVLALSRATTPGHADEPTTRGRPRGGPTIGGPRGGVPTLDRPRGGDSGTPAREQAPDELVAAIDEAAAAVDATTAQIVRIPHIDVDTELPVKPGRTFTVAVYLDKTPSRADEVVEPFELRDPPADEEIVVDVWLTSTPHFSIEGSATDVIVLRRNEDASDARALHGDGSRSRSRGRRPACTAGPIRLPSARQRLGASRDPNHRWRQRHCRRPAGTGII